MSAPQIPNLNSLRRGAGRGRGQGRGASSGAVEQGHGSNSNSKDKIIQNTDHDAATSRLSAVEAGYLIDPFAELFSQGGKVARRLPLMNRGTYIRTTAIDRLVESFLGPDQKSTRQIISLGSGSDTRFFRLKRSYPDIHLLYHELDFPANTAAKIRQMQMLPFRQSAKRNCDINLTAEPTIFTTDDAGNQSLHFTAGNSAYFLHPLDLRSLARPQRDQSTVHQELSQLHISTDVPTLVLSECCLIYLPPEDADSVLSYFTRAFQPTIPVGVIIYEPIRPHDAFGRTMVSNLTARGIQLQTLNAHDTLGAQKERLRKHGSGSREGSGAGGGGEAADVDFIWQTWTEETEKERVENLEWMDEVEEWKLLARHYCVAWGWKESSDRAGDAVFEKWAHLPVQEEGE